MRSVQPLTCCHQYVPLWTSLIIHSINSVSLSLIILFYTHTFSKEASISHHLHSWALHSFTSGFKLLCSTYLPTTDPSDSLHKLSFFGFLMFIGFQFSCNLLIVCIRLCQLPDSSRSCVMHSVSTDPLRQRLCKLQVIWLLQRWHNALSV